MHAANPIVLTENLVARFWAHVERRGDDECWLWRGHERRVNEYGAVGEAWNGPKSTAQRVSWVIHNGAIPEGLFVCHRCDARACVNPAHLFLGTPKDNTQDALRKGRMHNNQGEDNARHRLSADDVRKIRAMAAGGNLLHREIAGQFGVCRTIVTRIVNRRIWRSI